MTHCIGLGAKDIMEVCEAVELSCAELYHYFAYRFKDDNESFRLWLKLAMEEENHARLFALVGKLRRTNIEFIQFESVEADVALLYVRALIEKVKNNPPPFDDALRVAIDLNYKIGKFMEENVVKFAYQSCEKSFLAMANASTSCRISQGQASRP